jgi:uncharacterized membrane protein YdbT with pleckstrin-like domain
MSEEQTVFKGSPSLVIHLGRFTLCGLVFIACLVGGFLIPQPYSFVLFGLALVALIYAAVQWALVKSRVYEVTTERIRISSGILSRRTDELELYRVKDTTLIEPLFMRLLSLGDIEISTHDVSTPIVRLDAIKGARRLREELRKNVEACRDKKRVRLAELE